MKLSNHLHIVLRLKMSGAIHRMVWTGTSSPLLVTDTRRLELKVCMTPAFVTSSVVTEKGCL